MVKEIPERKKFDGDFYKQWHICTTKKTAKSFAENARSAGWKARTKRIQGKYVIYIRKT